MAAPARDTVAPGFTTASDLGGDVTGLVRAIDRDVATGPRIVRAGRMPSQTRQWTSCANISGWAIAPGAHGDLVLSRVDPIDDLVGFADHERALPRVIQAGLPVVDRTADARRRSRSTVLGSTSTSTQRQPTSDPP